MKLDILAFGAHPDDIELSAGGTLAKHIQLGKQIGIIDLSKGELGTRGNAEIRAKEAATAKDILGVAIRENLGLPDGFIENKPEYQMELVKAIRRFQPQILIANATQDRHPDHSKAASLVSDACFLSGLIKLESEWEGSPQDAWRPKIVFHYIQERYIAPDLVVDITAQQELKMEAVNAYRSQFFDPDSAEPETNISNPDYLEFLEDRATEMGSKIGVEYGEGFTVAKNAGVEKLYALLQ